MCLQISIFVLPIIVLVGWIIGKPFTLNFDPFATIMLTLSVIHAYFVSSDGNSNWCGAVAVPWACALRPGIDEAQAMSAVYRNAFTKRGYDGLLELILVIMSLCSGICAAVLSSPSVAPVAEDQRGRQTGVHGMHCRLMGVQLIATYLLIALLYLFVPGFAPNTNHT